MHSMPWPSSFSRSPFSEKRATPITRRPGSARFAMRASVGPHLAADAEDEDVAGCAREVRGERRGRARHDLLQRLHVLEV